MPSKACKFALFGYTSLLLVDSGLLAQVANLPHPRATGTNSPITKCSLYTRKQNLVARRLDLSDETQDLYKLLVRQLL